MKKGRSSRPDTCQHPTTRRAVRKIFLHRGGVCECTFNINPWKLAAFAGLCNRFRFYLLSNAGVVESVSALAATWVRVVKHPAGEVVRATSS